MPFARPRFALPQDPRLSQIAAQAALLGYGAVALGFDVGPARIALQLAAALAVQYLGTVLAGRARFDWRSALPTGLSLCLLLRTDSAWLAAAGSGLAIGSKFALRWRGRHIFNPSNFALVALLALTPRAWVSPGQWGSPAVLALFAGGLGLLVLTRARRLDVAVAFLAAWAALLAWRGLAAGEPAPIALHRLCSGSLLVFSLFMLTDPKTTPASRAGRLVFAALVALGAFQVQFRLFRPNGPLWALAACSPLVPLLDRLFPGEAYEWPQTTKAALPQPKGAAHETRVDAGAGVRA